MPRTACFDDLGTGPAWCFHTVADELVALQLDDVPAVRPEIYAARPETRRDRPEMLRGFSRMGCTSQ